MLAPNSRWCWSLSLCNLLTLWPFLTTVLLCSTGPAVVVARAGGGGGGARAARPLGVRRAPAGARSAEEEDAARTAPPVAAVPLPAGQWWSLNLMTIQYTSRFNWDTSSNILDPWLLSCWYSWGNRINSLQFLWWWSSDSVLWVISSVVTLCA